MTSIAFLGIGIMGAQMARRLCEAGHAVTARNRTPAKTKPLTQHGARIAQSEADAILPTRPSCGSMVRASPSAG